MSLPREPAADVAARVGDPQLVEERRDQILEAAIFLFSREDHHRVTVRDIAHKAGISTGLIYQYFGDKEDILYLSLLSVLNRYETELPILMAGHEDPVDRLHAAIAGYCRIVDSMQEASLLAYRASGSLPAPRRQVLRDAETRTNRIITQCLENCSAQGLMGPVDAFLLTYELVLHAHGWALKNWALRDRYGLEDYVRQGLQLLVRPHLVAAAQSRLDLVMQREGKS